jgi:putative ABC transport system permease protein
VRVSPFLQIFRQSLVLSFEEIRAAKLRSSLSLLGITIGILCIISVRTAVNSMEMNIQSSLASFGNDILYVQKWPWIWADGNDYAWWKYLNRPNTNRRELEQLQERMKGAEGICILYFSGNANVIAGENVAERTAIQGVSYDYDKIKEMEFTQGRYFTPAEANHAQAVALVGADVAETLFPGRNNIEGEQMKIKGVKVTVVGVLKKEGSDLFGFTLDNNVIVPFSFMNMFVNTNDIGNDPLLALVPKKGVPMDELRYELKGAMRSVRRLSPYEEDNFAINQVSVFTEGIAGIFSIINIAGLFIGGFSILVGTFGIANIMFVSVQERVYQIGIKKALGAKKLYILLEFLLEAVMLCVFGGLIGLIVVIILFKILGWVVASSGSDFKFYITATNIIIGISISVITGILAGFIPAWSAANMKPVDAIRGEVSDLLKGIMKLYSRKPSLHKKQTS